MSKGKDPAPETGWLIEFASGTTHRWWDGLGWAGPDAAIRFARKEDAQHFVERSNHFTEYELEHIVYSEHQWG